MGPKPRRQVPYSYHFRSTAPRSSGSVPIITSHQIIRRFNRNNTLVLSSLHCVTPNHFSKIPGRLLNKVAVITGSSSGLSRAISLHYAREGAIVICSDLKPTARLDLWKEQEIETHVLIKKEGGKAIFIKADVGIAGDMEALVKAAVKEYGRLDM